MPVRCSICSSEKGLELSKALLAGESFRSVVSLFPSFSFGAVSRHSRKCLNRKISTNPNPKPQKNVHLPKPGISSRISDAPENRITDAPYDAEVEELALSAQAAREKGDLRLAFQFSALKLRALDLRQKEKEKARAAEPDKITGFEDWSTENLFALEHTKEALQLGTVTAEDVEQFLEMKKAPELAP